MTDRTQDRRGGGPDVAAGIRAGDVLRVRCAPVDAQVTDVAPNHVSVAWPWGEVDPDSRFRWNGRRAFPRRPGHPDGDMELFRLEPDPAGLAVGNTCRVGIPETTVHVLSVQHFDPPRDLGWLPRPDHGLHVLRHGQSFDPELDDQGCVLYPGGQEPMELGLLFRPYAFMEAGDEVADADGATWRFAHPWSWRSPQGQPGVPVWPLALRTRGGRRVEGEPVVSATVGGSHEGEEDTWRGLTGAEPVAP